MYILQCIIIFLSVIFRKEVKSNNHSFVCQFLCLISIQLKWQNNVQHTIIRFQEINYFSFRAKKGLIYISHDMDLNGLCDKRLSMSHIRCINHVEFQKNLQCTRFKPEKGLAASEIHSHKQEVQHHFDITTRGWSYILLSQITYFLDSYCTVLVFQIYIKFNLSSIISISV